MRGDFRHEIDVATRLVRSAGSIIMKIYHTDFIVQSKGDAGPVTEADQRANDVIREGLHRAFPADLVVSEESAMLGTLEASRVWYVDPLDGTQEFVTRNDEFSVLVGLAVNGQATLGLIHRPVDAALFIGIAGAEAWVEHDGGRTRLVVSDLSDPHKLQLVVSRSHRHPLIDEMRSRIGITRESRCGSVGLKIARLAQRRADVYLEPSGLTNTWDLCGPEAVLRGASGRLTDLAGLPLVYRPSDHKNRRGVVATNGACHDRVINAIAPVAHATGLV